MGPVLPAELWRRWGDGCHGFEWTGRVWREILWLWQAMTTFLQVTFPSWDTSKDLLTFHNWLGPARWADLWGFRQGETPVCTGTLFTRESQENSVLSLTYFASFRVSLVCIHKLNEVTERRWHLDTEALHSGRLPLDKNSSQFTKQCRYLQILCHQEVTSSQFHWETAGIFAKPCMFLLYRMPGPKGCLIEAVPPSGPSAANASRPSQNHNLVNAFFHLGAFVIQWITVHQPSCWQTHWP